MSQENRQQAWSVRLCTKKYAINTKIFLTMADKNFYIASKYCVRSERDSLRAVC